MKEYKYKINGNEYKVAVGDVENDIVQVEVNGTPYKVELEAKATATKVSKVKSTPAPAPRTETGAKIINSNATATMSAGESSVKSPLPGVIMDIKVKVGDTVKSGDTVIILEAMKMDNDVHASSSGTVKAINVNKGDSVQEGADLIIIS